MIEIVEVNYLQIRGSTVAKAIKYVMNNPETYYCLMFGKLILKPFELVKELEKSLDYVEEADFMLIVLKNS